MKTRTVLILAAVVVALVVGLAWSVYRVTLPRVVGRALAPDGTEMCVVQQFNWSFEPFTTTFVFHKPLGPWQGFYYDHQDDYWGRSRASLDPVTQTAVFYRGGAPAVTFAWNTSTYTLHRSGRVETQPGQLPDGWTPTQSVYKR